MVKYNDLPSYAPADTPLQPMPSGSGGQAVILSQVKVYAPVGPKSSPMACPNCQAIISTDTRLTASSNAHKWCCLLASTGCLLCFWIPYVMRSCKIVHHYCPGCNHYLGNYSQ